LGREQVPSGEALAALNARIRAWASERKGVVVVPLADLIAKLHAGVEIRIRGNHWAADARAKLIGPDRLHPTLEGAAALWVASLDALAAARTELPVSTFDWSAAAVVQRVVDGKAQVREDNRRRAEERAKRAEKRQGGGDPAGG
jgi:hypothetical protein